MSLVILGTIVQVRPDSSVQCTVLLSQLPLVLTIVPVLLVLSSKGQIVSWMEMFRSVSTWKI